jgi:hypothetical protein
MPFNVLDPEILNRPALKNASNKCCNSPCNNKHSKTSSSSSEPSDGTKEPAKQDNDGHLNENLGEWPEFGQDPVALNEELLDFAISCGGIRETYQGDIQAILCS